MLQLKRREGEEIIINNSVKLTVLSINENTVTLGWTFSENDTVLRKELYDKITNENIAASSSKFLQDNNPG